MCVPNFLIGNRNPVNFKMVVITCEFCWDFSLTTRVFYMLMFSCCLSIRAVRKLKCVIYFNFISSDSIQSKTVFECMVSYQNGFSFN